MRRTYKYIHCKVMSNPVSQIISAIRRRRMRLQYSKEYVADKLNISQNKYSRIELGKTTLTLSQLFQICDVLEMDVQEILKVRRKSA